MRIGEIERVGEREIPTPTFIPTRPEAAPSSPPLSPPSREREPSEPERAMCM